MKQLQGTYDTAAESRLRAFGLLTLTTFFFISFTLVLVDAVPEVRVRADDASIDLTHTNVATEGAEQDTSSSHVSKPESKIPTRIVVHSIGIDTPVLSPQSTDIATLDRALLSGAVRYPGSVSAGEKGTLLIFGHSSHLPIVRNKAFQAFNDLEKIETGSTIEVHSSTHRYTYTVTEVKLGTAASTIVHFDADSPQLMLSTCNTFGEKQERWVVTARLTDKREM